jgi:hypothetical protein
VVGADTEEEVSVGAVAINARNVLGLVAVPCESGIDIYMWKNGGRLLHVQGTAYSIWVLCCANTVSKLVAGCVLPLFLMCIGDDM